MSELFDVMEYFDLCVRIELAQRPERDQGQRRAGLCGVSVDVS